MSKPEDKHANPKKQEAQNQEAQNDSFENSGHAIALFYDGDSAPTVSAKGDAELAQEILAIAKEHGVPIYQNPELVSQLATLELGDEIPELLYLAIAEIIAFVYHLQEKAPVEKDT